MGQQLAVIIGGMMLAGSLIIWAAISFHNDKQDCEKKSGVLISSPSGYVCIDKRVLK
jgi:hypothetical protein